MAFYDAGSASVDILPPDGHWRRPFERNSFESVVSDADFEIVDPAHYTHDTILTQNQSISTIDARRTWLLALVVMASLGTVCTGLLLNV